MKPVELTEEEASMVLSIHAAPTSRIMWGVYFPELREVWIDYWPENKDPYSIPAIVDCIRVVKRRRRR